MSKEGLSSSNSIIRAFGEAFDLDLDPNLGDKHLKKKIIKGLDFNKEVVKIPGVDKEFRMDQSDGEEMDQYINEQIDKGNFVTIRFLDDKGAKSGGHPVIYTGEREDYRRRKRVDSQGRIIAWEAIDEREILLEPSILTEVFSRRKSVAVDVHDLDNYQGDRNTRIGGGFRMQLDRVNVESPGFDFSSIFVFDDVGPRSTSLNSYFDRSVPRVTTIVSAEQRFDGLVTSKISPSDQEWSQILSRGNVKEISELLTNTLFEKNKLPLSFLFNALMDVRSLGGLHSIEAIFSFQQSDKGIYLCGPFVIDFDGIDTLPQWQSKSGFSLNSNVNDAVERMTGAHLALMRKFVDNKHYGQR